MEPQLSSAGLARAPSWPLESKVGPQIDANARGLGQLESAADR